MRTLSKEQNNSVWILIKSLDKTEKRYIQLYARNKAGESLKFMQLFDALENMVIYDENKLLKTKTAIKKDQLRNLRSRLYQHILESLRNMYKAEHIVIHLREQLDFAKILSSKNFYSLCLRVLNKVKTIAELYHQTPYLIEALVLEQTITIMQILPNMHELAEQTGKEIQTLNEKTINRNALSTLSLQLYSRQQKLNHVHNVEEMKEQNIFFKKKISEISDYSTLDFYGKLYWHQCHNWHYTTVRNYIQSYKYSKKWVDLFEENPQMKNIEPVHYARGFHNILYQLYRLRNSRRMISPLQQLETFYLSEIYQHNDETRLHSFIYYYTSYTAFHMLQGTFDQGLKVVPLIEKGIIEFKNSIDWHREVALYYRIAYLYFGNQQWEYAIDYLNKIINRKSAEIKNERNELSSYARLLNLIIHYELGNTEILEHLALATYRYMKQMKKMSEADMEILKFLKKSFYFNLSDINEHFKTLLNKLKEYEKNASQYSLFIYLDATSWLESKIENRLLKDVIQGKLNYPTIQENQ